MSEPKQILLFGDQTNAFDEGIRKLSQHKDNAFLISFLERCHFALRAEIGKLPASQRELFPRFTSVLDLLARYRKSGDNPALEGALTCVHQVACFIRYYGLPSRTKMDSSTNTAISYYAGASQTYPLAAETHISGLCTGLLAAAAISSSRAIADLLPAAIEAVLIAFRTGLRTMEVRDRICKRSTMSPNWSVVVSGLEEKAADAALKDFARAKGLPSFSQPYISAVNANSLTISGPPSTLDQLLRSPSFESRKSVKAPIFSPYHAAHLYQEEDVNAILAQSSEAILGSYTPKIPMISSTTGEIIRAADYGALLRIALHEIFLEPFRWQNVFEACQLVAKSSSSICKLVPIATNVTQSLSTALRQAGNEVKVQNITATTHEWNTLSTGRPSQSKIAIIGLSGRFPDAESPDHFWDLLYQGLDVHREIPKDRFDVKTHFDPTGKKKNATQVPYGCFIENPGLFDARFFNMSPKEAAQADPAQRLAIVTAYEALEQAGFVANRTPSSQRDRVGLFYGMTSDDWREVNSGQNVDTYFIPGGNRAFTPGRINYHFKFSGPSVSVDTACSSSLAAIHTACNALWQGDCDTALAGGTNLMTNPDNFTGLDKGHFLSRTGNCKTFDDGADGYCRSDAVGTVVLKRLEDAELDNDPIQGVILGACTNHSAEAVSITRPDIGAQAFVFDKVLNGANIDPNEISYIEMHGTGTQAGDAVEMASCLEVFAPDTRARKTPLYLGSAKANVGHAESASGVTSLIKVMLMMRENMIPPHCGIKTKINHNFPTDLKERDVHIAFRPTPWRAAAGKKRKVFLNNFSAAGGNTALLLEDAPKRHVEDNDSRPLHAVAVSARSIVSLQKNASALVKFVDAQRDLSLASLSYTTTARRVHHNYRLIVSGTSLTQITENLLAAAQRDRFEPIPSRRHHVAFAFTGQGSQYAGMGKQLYDNLSQFRSEIKQLDGIVQSQGFPTVVPVIDGSTQITEISELSPVVVQLATTCLQIALARLWYSWGVQPSVVIGHSLGEYAALHVAGVLSASDTIYLVGKRAELLMEQCEVGTHSMLAVKATANRLGPFLGGRGCEIACINAPEETVISGTNGNIDMFAQDLTGASIKCTKLRVPFAFHSAQVEPILREFEKIASGVTFHKPSIPVISPLLGEVITEQGVFSPVYLSRHCREPVNFLKGLEKAREAHLVSDSDLSVELGPHSVCSGMIKAAFGPKFSALPSLRRNEDTWKVVVSTLSSLYLAGIDINWSEYHRDFSQSHEALSLPAYSWDNKNHWIQYVHDWCLTKGDPPHMVEAQPEKPKLSTTSVQSVIEEEGDKNTARIVVQSDIADPALNGILQGHRVNGAPLCPSSLYADMALTIGDYLVSRFNPDIREKTIDVANMSVIKALVAKPDQSSQLLRACALVDWSAQSATVDFYIVNGDGKKIADHASCKLRYGNGKAWQEEWQRIAYLIKPCLNRLQTDVAEGQSHKMKRGMAYRVFSSMVEYAPSYRGIEEVVLDSSQLESTALVKLQTHEHGNFTFSPYWIETLGHIAGFVMNGNDAVDHKTTAYLNHGWDSMRCADFKAFSTSKTYQTYVKMQPYENTTRIGDVYIFDEGKIIAVFGGVKFQAVPRRLLDSVLPPTAATKATPRTQASPSSKPKAAPGIKTPKSKSVTMTVPTPSGSNILERALTILADEIGVPVSDLSNETEFNDMGVDSLLSLTISGKIREELAVDLESSIFAEYPSVRDFKLYFSKNHTAAPSVAATTPAETPEISSDSDREDAESMTSIEDEDDGQIDEQITTIRMIIAEEIGVSVAEIQEDADLGELGMDSLMALTITGRVREELPDMDIPSDFFSEHNTLDAIGDALGLKPKPTKAVAAPASVPKQSALPTASTSVQAPATSILLQGNPKTATKILWLFPDGSGSATSYAPLGRVSSSTAIYGLNCPYVKTPENLTCSLEGLTPPYLTEIKRRQPTGPYYLGGWSAGGICAFDAAQTLLRNGEVVERLILIDSPFPIGLEKLPPRLYDFFESIGMFGGGSSSSAVSSPSPPSWLIKHFLAFVDALDRYHAQPLPAQVKPPKTFIIWAKDGVCKYPDSPRPKGYQNEPGTDPKEMRWLLENRTDFGPNGWDTLVGGVENVHITLLEDANHFSMMQGDKANAVARFVEKAVN
ncbi:MAG: hypothetical protein Q9163_002686 [Psora crenata]